jgi:formate dehydrogenase major subunit
VTGAVRTVQDESRTRQEDTMTISLPIDPEANALLDRSPLALLIGMLLDQQVPLERAFAAPYELARRLGHDLGSPRAEDVWNELRSLSPMHAGMSYARLEALGGIQWPCYSEDTLEPTYLHGRLWQEPLEGPPAPFHVVEDSPPTEALSDEFPLRLTTGRRLDSFNTGVQSGGFTSPLRRGEEIELSAQDAEELGVETGERVRVTSARGSLVAPVRVQSSLRPGLAFMTLHFPDEVLTNVLTINATDPKSGTAEFKATAIRVDRLAPGEEEEAAQHAAAQPAG